MSDLRLLQNFSGFRALIVVEPAVATDTLTSTLGRLGVETERLLPAAAHERWPDLNPDQHVVFLDGDLDEPANLPLSRVGRLPPAPVIGLLGVAAPTRLKALLRQGATAILHKPVQGAAVFASLFVGVNEFRRRRQFETLLDRQERRLRGRRAVITAVIRTMRERGLDEDEAYQWLRRTSMASRTSVEELCEQIAAAPTGGPHDQRGKWRAG